MVGIEMGAMNGQRAKHQIGKRQVVQRLRLGAAPVMASKFDVAAVVRSCSLAIDRLNHIASILSARLIDNHIDYLQYFCPESCYLTPSADAHGFLIDNL